MKPDFLSKVSDRFEANPLVKITRKNEEILDKQ